MKISIFHEKQSKKCETLGIKPLSDARVQRASMILFWAATVSVTKSKVLSAKIMAHTAIIEVAPHQIRRLFLLGLVQQKFTIRHTSKCLMVGYTALLEFQEIHCVSLVFPLQKSVVQLLLVY